MKKYNFPSGFLDSFFELKDAPEGYENYFNDSQRYALKAPFLEFEVSQGIGDTISVRFRYEENGVVQWREYNIYPSGAFECLSDALSEDLPLGPDEDGRPPVM